MEKESWPQDIDSDFIVDAPLPSHRRRGDNKIASVIIAFVFAEILLMFVMLMALAFGIIPKIFVPALVFVLFAAPVVVFLFVKKHIRSSQQEVKNTEMGQIQIKERNLILPSALVVGNAATNRDTIAIDILNIQDLNTLPGGKNSPAQFVIELKRPYRGESKLHFYNTLSSDKVKDLYEALHKQSGLSDKQSPFGKSAQKTRTSKSRASGVAFLALVASLIPTFIFTFFAPPLYFYSGVVDYLVFALPLGLFLMLILRFGVFPSAFKSGFGREMRYEILIALAYGLALSMLISVDYFTLMDVSQTEAVVSRKFTRRHKKGRRSYHVALEIDWPRTAKVKQFEETPSLRILRKQYASVTPRQTQLQVSIGQGVLGVPRVTDYRILNSSAQTGNTRRPDFNQHRQPASQSRAAMLKTWTANNPPFEKPDRYKEVRWPTGN